MNSSNTIIIISHFSEKEKKSNVDWVRKLIELGFHTIVYDHKYSSTNPYYVKENKGREASVYLKYIIDFYDSLQPFTIFLQDEEKSWHHDGSIVDIIKNYEKKIKYHNFNNRCLALIKPNNLFPMMKDYFQKCLESYIGPIEKYGDWTAGYPCCSQFIVHRDYIRKYPKKMYEDMFKYMMDGRHDEKAKGHMFEWTLHLLFDNPFLMHNMTEEKFKKLMEKRERKIEKAKGDEEKVFFDGCRVIVNY